MRHILTLTIALTLLAGCAGRQASAPTAAPQPSAAATTTAPLNDTPVPAGAPTSGPAAPLDLEAARVGIQATLNDYARAYATGNAELLRSTVDQSNAPFRRLVQERFEMTQASALSGADSFTVSYPRLKLVGFTLALPVPFLDWHPGSMACLQRPCRANPAAGTYAEAHDLQPFTHRRFPRWNLQGSVGNVR